METSAERLENNRVEVTVKVDAKDVDKTIASTYKDLAKKYRFPGFRPGHAPRPVIDSQLGREAVLAQATETLVNDLEPSIRDEQDIVSLGDPMFPEPAMVAPGEDLTFKVVYLVRPQLTLTSFDPVDVTVPSEEATEAEIDAQVETFRGYFGTYDDIEGRAVEAGDTLYIKLEEIENAKNLTFANRLYRMGTGMLPEAFDEAIVGMNVGDSKEVSFEVPQPEPAEGEEAPEPIVAKVNVTINRLVTHNLPEVTDEFANTKFGFADVAAMREAIAKDLGAQKKQAIPQIKEAGVTRALATRLEGEATPEYVNTIFQELGQNFLAQLQQRGQSLDTWLAMNGLDSNTFLADLNRQASDIARESLALDALVAEKGFEATQADIDAEFQKAGVEDWEATKKEFEKDGRIPAIRVSIRRNKAIDWLLETANVTVSDTPVAAAEEPAAEAEEKKPAKKRASKKAAKAEDAEPAAEAEAEEPKKTTRKRSTKKAAEAEGEAAEAEEKPAPKKRASKKAKAEEQPADEAAGEQA